MASMKERSEQKWVLQETFNHADATSVWKEVPPTIEGSLVIVVDDDKEHDDLSPYS